MRECCLEQLGHSLGHAHLACHPARSRLASGQGAVSGSSSCSQCDQTPLNRGCRLVCLHCLLTSLCGRYRPQHVLPLYLWQRSVALILWPSLTPTSNNRQRSVGVGRVQLSAGIVCRVACVRTNRNVRASLWYLASCLELVSP
jgi:hypothetical protein